MASSSPFRKSLFRFLTYGVILGSFGEHFRQKYNCFEAKYPDWLKIEPIKDLFTAKPKSLKSVNSLYSTGERFFNDKQYSESLAYFKKAVEIIEQEATNDNLLLCKCYLYIARVYQAKEKSLEALEKSEKALNILLENQIEDKALLAEAYHYHGISYGLRDEYYKARKSLQTALELKKTHFGKNTLSTAETYHELYKLYFKYENFAEAVQSLSSALEICAEYKNNGDKVRPELNLLYMSDFLNIINTIASVKDKQFDDVFLRAKQYLLENPNINKDTSSAFFHRYGKFLIYRGDRDEGFGYLKKSLEILKASHGKTDPKVQTLYRELYSTYMSYFRDPGELTYLMKL